MMSSNVVETTRRVGVAIVLAIAGTLSTLLRLVAMVVLVGIVIPVGGRVWG